MLNWKSVMYFGKYKGETLEDIFERDPSYLVWVSNNIVDLEFSDDIIETIVEYEIYKNKSPEDYGLDINDCY